MTMETSLLSTVNCQLSTVNSELYSEKLFMSLY